MEDSCYRSETARRVAARRQELKRERRRRSARAQTLLAVFLVAGLGLYFVFEARGGRRATGQVSGPLSSGRRAVLSWPKPREFARVAGTGLSLYLPGADGDMIAVGFHEADNPRAMSLEPVSSYLRRVDATAVKVAVSRGSAPFFVMNTRNRRTSPTSAADIAVRSGALLTSPVDGVVTIIKPYYLYGRYFDYHVEIEPAGYPELRVALIHLDKLRVKLGGQVAKGETILGSVRSISRIQTQINRYLPRNAEHVHLQVNPAVQ